MKERRSLIKDISTIFALGYVPSRGDESYLYKTKSHTTTASLCNCFGHACFNLTNQQLDDLNIYDSDIIALQGYCGADLSIKTKSEITKHLFKIVKDAGLIVKPCTKESILKNNQWKVALYFDELSIYNKTYLRDFHFLKQEKDGSWSSKIGYRPEVKKVETLPKQYDYYYSLYGVYSITNPNAKEK